MLLFLDMYYYVLCVTYVVAMPTMCKHIYGYICEQIAKNCEDKSATVAELVKACMNDQKIVGSNPG